MEKIVILKQVVGEERVLHPKDLLVLNEDGTVRVFNGQDEVDIFWEWSRKHEPFLYEDQLSVFDDIF